MVFGVIGLGFLAFYGLQRMIYSRMYADYDRHLSYAEIIFIDNEFERVRKYARARSYPIWFRFVWLRDIAIIAVCTLVVIFAVYLLQYGVKMFTGGLVEKPKGLSGFETGVKAPLVASMLGICVGVWATSKLSARSQYYRKFAEYIASMSRKRSTVHIEHFYRARLIGHERLKREPDLLLMIHERYSDAFIWALWVTGGFTALVFAWDIWRGF